MLTATEASLSDAETTFNTVEPTLQEAVKAINKNGVVPVEAVERLSILREILNGNKVLPFEKEYDRFITHTNKDGENDRVDIDKLAMEKAGYSIKDLVAPQCIMRSKRISY